MEKVLANIVNIFDFQGDAVECEPYGNGHINSTYLVVCREKENIHRYILQKVNRTIFPETEKLMENIINVIRFQKEKIKEAGGDLLRESLTLIPTKSGDLYYTDEANDVWRSYLFIKDSVSYDLVEKPEDFYHCGIAFGNFQKLLSEFPADSLYEVIPNFHNTALRYQTFLKAVEEDAHGRIKDVEPEISFVKDRAKEVAVLVDLLSAGKLPLRVTHNDTKLNNCMFDCKTGKPVCVIDLDTIMPGLTAYDYGDSIRFGATTAAEDERDLSKVHFSLPLFECYTKGFLESCGSTLTTEEIHSLPIGAKMMTLECGMRFLTDYLQGDVYFRTSRPQQNLDRCRTQFRLVKEMEENWEEMQRIVAACV